jgi:hypothetical protein
MSEKKVKSVRIFIFVDHGCQGAKIPIKRVCVCEKVQKISTHFGNRSTSIAQWQHDQVGYQEYHEEFLQQLGTGCQHLIHGGMVRVDQ